MSACLTYRHRLLDETASTNEDIKKAAEVGEAEGLVIQAVRQNAGVGRQGRKWESPEGNLYVSLLLRPRCSPQQAGFYAFVTPLAVYDVVASFLPPDSIKLKWPNDVLVRGQKICGILLEAGPIIEGKTDWLVVGTGINVQHHPEGLAYTTTSLHAEGALVEVDEILSLYLERFEHWRQILVNDGFDSIRRTWLERAQTGCMKARCGQETFEGLFQGLDENGCLILLLADGSEHRIASGDVFFTGN